MRLLHIFDLKCCRATSGGNGGLSAIHRKLVFFFEWVVKVKPFFPPPPGAIVPAGKSFRRRMKASANPPIFFWSDTKKPGRG